MERFGLERVINVAIFATFYLITPCDCHVNIWLHFVIDSNAIAIIHHFLVKAVQGKCQ